VEETFFCKDISKLFGYLGFYHEQIKYKAYRICICGNRTIFVHGLFYRVKKNLRELRSVLKKEKK
jgi:hypothetical protein